ncbi:MAG: exopolyphosphatase [Eubacteriales bacterium]|nr:exopolyphosphatase [Eubacteriales bacterium]
MKIFEMLPHKGVRRIDYVSHRIELGADTYTEGKISIEKIDELCRVLKDFQRIMAGYQVESWRACATSAVREAQNKLQLVEHVKRTTGIEIENLDNSEQRFLDYKSVALGVRDFFKIIQESTAIVDVGSGSIQISLFDKDKLVTTQNIRIGNLRIREKVADLAGKTLHMEAMVEELISNEIISFKKMYLKDRQIRHLVVGGDYVSDLLEKESVSSEEFKALFMKVIECSPEEIAREYGIPSESASLILPSLTLYKRLIEELGAETIWVTDMALSDGMAYDFAQKKKYIRVEHDFNDDIIAAARVIAKRYQCSKVHIKNLENIALSIFDKMKKVSGMNQRHRLLLQIAVILHGCGKYINLSNAADCSYNIIMSTEIIGLSLKERRIIANAVKYNTQEFHYEDAASRLGMSPDDYLLILKLTAILRVSNALDRSHKQKFENIKVQQKEHELIISTDTREDITLEKGLFPPKAEFFEDVFHVRPVIHQKKHF